jgi:hypothetical protein
VLRHGERVTVRVSVLIALFTACGHTMSLGTTGLLRISPISEGDARVPIELAQKADHIALSPPFPLESAANTSLVIAIA